MDAAELRQMQAPIKERYKTDPKAAMITLKAKGSTDSEGIACKVETGRAIAMAGLHPATGGSGLELCSGDMTRAPFVMGKAQEAFSRSAEIFDTTIGWRFINPLLKAQYGVDAMPETGENVAEEFQVSRADQDAFAIRSQQRAGKAIAAGYFAEEITPITIPGGKAGPITVDKDEHPRPETTLEGLAKLKPIVRNPGTVTAGNASGVNDGAAAMPQIDIALARSWSV